MKKICGIWLSCLLLSSHVLAADKITVLLDWFVNPDHAPLFVAQHQGFFAAEGLDVDLIGPADPVDPPKLVAAGKADIAITYQPQFLEQVDRGLPLVMVGALVNQPLTCLVVLKDGNIKKIADLKDKKIGFSGSGVNSVSLQVMLNKHHLNRQAVEIINTHYNLTQALLAHKVDAVTGMMRNFELKQLELSGHPGKAFYPEQNGMPTYSELIFVVNKNHINNDKIIRFMRALKRATGYLQQYPDQEWQAFAKQYPELNNALNKSAWMATLPYFANDPKQIDQHKFMDFAVFMNKNGLIKSIAAQERYLHLYSTTLN